MMYVMNLSGGVASAVAADRAIQRYGRKKVILRFADTKWEDEDLYRFMDDCMRRWGGRLYTFTDGRNPLEVAEQRGLIPNSRFAPCSYELKVRLLDDHLWRLPRPITMLLGLDWSEMHRIERRHRWTKFGGKWRRPSSVAHKIPGVYEDFPLLWKPYEFRSYVEVVKDWGIEPPRLYAMGFKHNNCGGRCVKAGQDNWRGLLYHFPERFAEVRDWETAQRAKGGPRADWSILKTTKGGESRSLTLTELEAQAGPEPGEPVQMDMFSCFCELG